MEELRILSTTAILGYGFPEESFREGVARKPHVIAVDAGSTDPGPYYLGAGISFTARAGVKRDLEFMFEASMELGVPLIVGTCGGSGADAHLDWNVDIVKEISREKGYTFKLAIIGAEVSKDVVLQKFRDGKITPLHPAPDATEDAIKESVRIVGQMGFEPFLKALEMGAQVILAGRAYDPAVFAALGVQKGYDKGLAIHLGKILECAALACTPGSGSDCLFGYLGEDYFRLEPLSTQRKCTTLSVAAHTLYEKTDPYVLPGPGGALDLTATTFEQESDNTVVVRGSKFVPSDGHFIKLEGVKRVGYRTVSIAAASDPIFIEQVDTIVEEIKKRCASNFERQNIGKYFLDFKLYGKNGVMSMFSGMPSQTPTELGIVIEAVAETQEAANTICAFARSGMLHFGYSGRKSTAGNLAFPFSPSDFKVGEAFTFSLYHLMEVSDPLECFPITLTTLDKGELV
ncbi:MAG: DUF1446 domain-containing protein [Defluviitaleaceae bacterium]|nr:DUF1446 domain-containing protein [Defluviitaleaceae bacterium]